MDFKVYNQINITNKQFMKNIINKDQNSQDIIKIIDKLLKDKFINKQMYYQLYYDIYIFKVKVVFCMMYNKNQYQHILNSLKNIFNIKEFQNHFMIFDMFQKDIVNNNHQNINK